MVSVHSFTEKRDLRGCQSEPDRPRPLSADPEQCEKHNRILESDQLRRISRNIFFFLSAFKNDNIPRKSPSRIFSIRNTELCTRKEKMRDRYSSFQELAANETQGVDYEIECARNGSGILVMAPHGGKIEFFTSELAAEIAKNDLSFYAFKGVKKSGNRFLHITSHRFDEPSALNIVSNADAVIAVHGAKSNHEAFVMVGGLDDVLVEKIESGLVKAGFDARNPDEGMGAVHPDNICNRGKRRKGVQLELSRKLRQCLKENAIERGRFVDAVRNAAIP